MTSFQGSYIEFGSCSGWLHASWSDIGVLMCAGVGRDSTLGDMAVRLLAVSLAQSGFPTLRFDYPGTGDSLDLETDDPCDAWLASIDIAADVLKQAGVRQLVFCGVRLGAMLAALKARERDDVCAVVLIDAVTSGARYLRELQISTHLVGGSSETANDTLRIDGVSLRTDRDAPFRALDLTSIEMLPARHVLILDSGPSMTTRRLANRLRGLGSEVTEQAFEALTDYDRNGYVPQTSNINAVNEWLLSKMSPSPKRSSGLEPSVTSRISRENPLEKPLHFGTSGGLFGMLCQPKEADHSGLVVIIGNAGAASHHGVNRFHVTLARRLAAVGIASLRFDFNGLGESLPKEVDEASHVYETDRTLDIKAAIDAMENIGYRQFAVGGLCSGAFHVWRAALQDSRIQILVLLNPAVFFWRKGQPFTQHVNSSNRSTRFYISTMRSRRGWKRLFRGELNVVTALRTLSAHAGRRLVALSSQAIAALGWSIQEELPGQSMRRLSRRGVRTLVAVGIDDGGLEVVQSHFGKKGHKLTRLPGCSVALLSGVDHTLTLEPMRVAAAEVIVRFLAEAFPCDKNESPLKRDDEITISDQAQAA